MKCTTVNFSEIQHFQRLDAGFYIALKEFKEEVRKLKEKYTIDQVKLILEKVEDKDKRCLMVISRGRNIEKACRENPYLSLAIIKGECSNKIKELKAKILLEQDYLKMLTKIEAS